MSMSPEDPSSNPNPSHFKESWLVSRQSNLIHSADYVLSLVIMILFFALNLLASSNIVIGWPLAPTRYRGRSIFSTTPFEADYYGGDDIVNPFLEDVSPIAVSPDTKLVLGLNKYTHDTSLCAADARTGKVLFGLAKERIGERRKNHAGNVALLVEKCLDSLDLNLDAVEKVVVNNHHHRVLPLEQDLSHMEWEAELNINGGSESGYDDDENLFPGALQIEISHHLAHAYSTATQAPFDHGLIVVMDGMGETYRTMIDGIEDEKYTSDFDLNDCMEIIPNNLNDLSTKSRFDWREAESIYTFRKDSEGIHIIPMFKRFQEEHSPPTLYNHGFENMDSIGAVYSRASSHIFGDWNSCGKVMGLAPWRVYSWEDGTLKPSQHDKPMFKGSLWKEDFIIDRSLLKGMPLIARNDPDLFDPVTMVRQRRYDFDDDLDIPVVDEDVDSDEQTDNEKEVTKKKRLPVKVTLDAIGIAARVQQDLESATMDFVQHFKQVTGESNLCLAGGVALNSVMNGRLSRELGFKKVFISPYPGDDGISVGCAAFGLFGRTKGKNIKSSVPLWKQPISPYLGPCPSEFQIKLALEAAAPWLEVETIRNDQLRIERIVDELDKGHVVALYQGRSEMGPRALGHRSILADPRRKPLVRFINEIVKKRESFRPFAPSVLSEEAANWFDLGVSDDDNVSPYMSMTAMVKPDKRDLIPAVTHVDGSSRLQTVTMEAEPFYYKIIKEFFKRTDVPMVLNTSFNTIPAEPIVESPKDAIRSFLSSMGSIELLVLGQYVVRRKKVDLSALLGEGSDRSSDLKKSPSSPKRAGRAFLESSFELKKGVTQEEEVITTSRVRMPDRIIHHDTKNNWLVLTDELEGEILSICDGTNTINDIMAYFTMKDNEEGYTEEDVEDAREIFQQVTRRLIRLYEHGFLSW
jgi:predicted NodU family carbamoyl transferase